MAHNSNTNSSWSAKRADNAGAGDQGDDGFGSAGVLPCPVLYPWSDGRQDLQLGLILMLMSICSSEAESFTEFGLEAVTQQVRGCRQGGGTALLLHLKLD